MDEIWKPIPGYEGMYSVGNLGRIQTLERVVPSKNGSRQIRKAKILVGGVTDGYKRVLLYTPKARGKRRYLLVHRLVLEAFTGSCPRGLETRHLNGDRADNRLINLRYGTPKENAADRLFHGGYPRVARKLSPEDVRSIRGMLKKGVYQRDIAVKFSVDQCAISAIKIGKSWSWLK